MANGTIRTILGAAALGVGVAAIPTVSDFSNGDRFFVDGDGQLNRINVQDPFEVIGPEVLENATVIAGGQDSGLLLVQKGSDQAWGVFPQVGLVAEEVDIAIATAQTDEYMGYDFMCVVEGNSVEVHSRNPEEGQPRVLHASFNQTAPEFWEGEPDVDGGCTVLIEDDESYKMGSISAYPKSALANRI